MELLELRIKNEGKVLKGNVLKVGSFLNQQIDVSLTESMAEDVLFHFNDKGVTKVLTVEASGIALAYAVARKFNAGLVYAKKQGATNVEGNVFSAPCFSYTHNKQNVLVVPKEYITSTDKILIIDDFLANGQAVNALISIVEDAGASVVGVSCAVEKGFQGGGDALREKGIDVYSLALIDEMNEKGITFRKL